MDFRPNFSIKIVCHVACHVAHHVAFPRRRLCLPARNRSGGDARARGRPRPRRRYHFDRDGAGGRAGPRRPQCAPSRRDRRPAARRGGFPPAIARNRDRAPCARRRGGQGRRQADDDFRQCARHSRRRARCAQLPRPPFRHRHRHRRVRDPHRAHQGARHLHAQDHAGIARAGEIRGALRRRLQSPFRPRRRDADQGQPHRGGRRHRGGAQARQTSRRASGQDRDRGRFARSAQAKCSMSDWPTWC